MSDKRVLVSYFFGDDMIPLGFLCARAFRELGFAVHCFNSQIESRLGNALLKPANRLARTFGYRGGDVGGRLPIAKINFKKAMLKKAVSEFRPNWVFIIRAHQFVDAELVRELKQRYGVEKVIGWRVDGPLDSPGLLEDAAIYDHYFCVHQHGYSEKDGIHHLPAYGMDWSLYRNRFVNAPRQYRHEIVFVGGYNRRRQEIMNHLLHLPVEIYGKWIRANRFNWALRNHVKAKGIWGEPLVELYNTSKIVLNISGWDPSRFTGLNLRVFDVPATGAFLMTDYSPELSEYYEVGKDLVCFNDTEELADKLVYYLNNQDEREAIALNGYKRALTLPTITDRMRSLISIVEQH